MKNKNINSVLKLTLAIFTFLVANQAVWAAPQIAVTVKNPNPYTGNQSWFVYERKASNIIQDVVSIKNYGDEEANVKISAVDATTNDSGSFILKFSNETQKNIGAWTEISQQEIKIAPGERVDIPFTIQIPKDAPPSQYLGGIVAETGAGTNPDDKSGCANTELCSPSVSVKTRIGARIYLTIPGEINEKISLLDFQKIEKISDRTFFKFRIKNEGNIAYEPKAEIEIIDMYGKTYDKFEKPLGNSLPQSTIEPVISWDKKPPLFGRFSAKATVTFPQRFKPADQKAMDLTTAKSVTFIFIPWEIISPIVLAIFGLCGWIFYRKNKINKLKKGAKKYEVKEDEHIGDIAEIFKVNWKELALLNKLRPPYILKKGDTILIPESKNKN